MDENLFFPVKEPTDNEMKVGWMIIIFFQAIFLINWFCSSVIVIIFPIKHFLDVIIGTSILMWWCLLCRQSTNQPLNICHLRLCMWKPIFPSEGANRWRNESRLNDNHLFSGYLFDKLVLFKCYGDQLNLPHKILSRCYNILERGQKKKKKKWQHNISERSSDPSTTKRKLVIAVPIICLFAEIFTSSALYTLK